MDHMNQSNMMDPSSMYGLPPCSGSGCPTSLSQTTITTPTPGNPNLPTLEDIANYNYLSSYEQQQQHEQLQDVSNKELDKIRNRDSYPSPPSYTPGNQGTLSGNPNPNSNGTMDQLVPQSSPFNEMQPITPTTQPAPVTAESLQYMNGFLRTQIGRIVQVQFLIGTNTLVDRMGLLLAVGANYILLNEIETDDILVCDFYNIKFIRFYY